MQTQSKPDSVSKEILFDVIFGKSNEGIVLTKFDGTIEKANPAVSLILGYSLSELEGRNISEIIHVNDRFKWTPEVNNLLNGKVECIRATRTFITHSSHAFNCTVRTFPLHHKTEIVKLITFLWAASADPNVLSESIEKRLKYLEELIERYGKPEDWHMVNNIHLGDQVGGDNVGRDKTINSTTIFYFIGTVMVAITTLLAYIAYVSTFNIHQGEADPPSINTGQENHGDIPVIE